MRGLVFAAAFSAAALLSVGAQAAPLSSSQALSSAASSDVTLVAQGCGRGWHRIPNGRCVRNTSRVHGACWYVRGPAGGWRLVCG